MVQKKISISLSEISPSVDNTPDTVAIEGSPQMECPPPLPTSEDQPLKTRGTPNEPGSGRDICAVFVLYFLFALYQSHTYASWSVNGIAYAIGGAIGSLVIVVLLACPLAWLVKKILRPKSVVPQWVAFVAGVLLPIVLMMNTSDPQSEKEAAVRRDAQQLVTDLKSVLTNPNVPAPQATGVGDSEMKQLGDCVRRFAADMQADFLEMRRQCDVLGLDTVLAPKNLTTKASIQTGQQKLAKALELIDACYKRGEQLLDEFPAKVRVLNIPASMKESAITGYMESKDAGLLTLKKMQECERGIIVESLSLLRFMEERVGTFQEEGGKLLFATDLEAEQYNAFISRIKTFVATFQEVSTQAAKQAQAQVGNLESVVR